MKSSIRSEHKTCLHESFKNARVLDTFNVIKNYYTIEVRCAFSYSMYNYTYIG